MHMGREELRRAPDILGREAGPSVADIRRWLGEANSKLEEAKAAKSRLEFDGLYDEAKERNKTIAALEERIKKLEEDLKGLESL